MLESMCCSQLLEKKKELSQKVASLEEEARIAAGIKEEAHRLEQRCQQLQASNTALKKQLKALQQGHNQAKALTEQVTLPASPCPHCPALLSPACPALPGQVTPGAVPLVLHQRCPASMRCHGSATLPHTPMLGVTIPHKHLHCSDVGSSTG